jgi:hypothetical protein
VDYSYTMKATFAIDASAPLTTPYTEGTGSLTLVQTDGQFSKSSGRLNFPAQASAAWGDQGFYSAAVTRAAGRVFAGKFQSSAAAVGLGFATAQNVNITNVVHSLYLGGSNLIRPLDPAVNLTVGSYAFSTDYQFAIVLRTDGAALYIKGGVYTDWTLLWIDNGQTTATLYATFFNFSGAGSIDYVGTPLLVAPFNTDDGVATVNAAAPVSAAAYTAAADGIADFRFVLDGAPSADEQVGVKYRAQDASNYWHAYLQRNVGNTAWDFNLVSVSAGTPTSRINVTGVGTPDRIRVQFTGSLHDCYTYAAGTRTKRGAQINVSHLNTQTGINATYAAGNTATSLIFYPRTSAAYAALDNLSF